MNALTPQQQRIHDLLSDAGSKGINSYGFARELALQLPAVVFQLKKRGCLITTRRHKNASVDYIHVGHKPGAAALTAATRGITDAGEEYTWIYKGNTAIRVLKRPEQGGLFE